MAKTVAKTKSNPEGRPLKFKTAEELEEKIDEYIALSVYNEEKEQTGYPLTITGMALHLGFMSRQSMYDLENMPKFSYSIKRARLMIENAYEMNLFGKNPTGSIFALKNLGWKDKQELDIKQDTTVSFEDRLYVDEPKS